jgi:hypothetical protein
VDLFSAIDNFDEIDSSDSPELIKEVSEIEKDTSI